MLQWNWAVDVTYGIVHPGSMFDGGHVAQCRRLLVSVQGWYHICGNVNCLSKASPLLRSSMAPTSFGRPRPSFAIESLNVFFTYLEPRPIIQENLKTARDHTGTASWRRIKISDSFPRPRREHSKQSLPQRQRILTQTVWVCLPSNSFVWAHTGTMWGTSTGTVVSHAEVFAPAWLVFGGRAWKTVQICSKMCPKSGVIFRAQNRTHEMGTHYGCPSRAPKNETGIWPPLVGHDSAKIPNQGLYFSWDPVHRKFQEGFLVTALTPTSTTGFKKNQLGGRSKIKTSPERPTLRQWCLHNTADQTRLDSNVDVGRCQGRWPPSVRGFNSVRAMITFW